MIQSFCSHIAYPQPWEEKNQFGLCCEKHDESTTFFEKHSRLHFMSLIFFAMYKSLSRDVILHCHHCASQFSWDGRGTRRRAGKIALFCKKDRNSKQTCGLSGLENVPPKIEFNAIQVKPSPETR